MINWRAFLILGLVGVLACNAVLAAHIFALKRELYGHGLDAVVSLISGVRIDGERWVSSQSACHVIRFTADECPYCRSDEAAYAAFINAARQASCEIVELAPKAGGIRERSREGVVQLKFIDQDLGPSIFPLVTPQTIVLNRDRAVKWMRRGAFSASSLDEGITVIKSLSK